MPRRRTCGRAGVSWDRLGRSARLTEVARRSFRREIRKKDLAGLDRVLVAGIAANLGLPRLSLNGLTPSSFRLHADY
jgi:hypothetical protein